MRLNHHISNNFYETITGFGAATIRQWRMRGVPKRYRAWMREQEIVLALRILEVRGHKAEPEPAAPVQEESPVAASPKRKSRAAWMYAKEVTAAHFAQSGETQVLQSIREGEAYMGERAYWRQYMQKGNWNEIRAIHEAKQKEKPA